MYVAMAPAPSQPRWRMAHSQWESLAAATDQWGWRDWEMAEPSGDYENVCGCCWDSVINGEYWIKSWLIAPVECQERLLMELWTDWSWREMSESQSGQFPDWVPRPITWQSPVRSGLLSMSWEYGHHRQGEVKSSEKELNRFLQSARRWNCSLSRANLLTTPQIYVKNIVWRMFPTLFLNWNIKQNVPTDHIWYLLRRVDSSQAESEDDNIIRKSSPPETRETWEDPFNSLRIMRNSSRYKSKWWDSSPLSISWSPPIPPQSGKIVSSFDCLCEPRAGHVLERKELIRTCFRH